ncbi:MAG: hypothetical protein WA555_19265 [Candidatus Sulfotelmatobacter sp.]
MLCISQQVPFAQVPKLPYCGLNSAFDLILVANNEDVTGPACPKVGKDDLLEENRIERIGQQKSFVKSSFAAEEPRIHAIAPSDKTRKAPLSI